MIPWCHRRMVAIDCETTDRDPTQARLVTAAVAWVGGEQPTETITILADPGVEIPAEATAVHGITTEHAQAEGLPAAAAVAMVIEAIARRPEGTAVICMNARYDLTVLECEARRHELTPLSEREPPLQVVDIRVIDLFLDRYRKGRRTLADLCREYGARLDNAHDATADAVAAARVAWSIGNKIDVFRQPRNRQEVRELIQLRKDWDAVRHDLPALHEAQTRWAAEQAAGLEEHFRRTGTPERVAREWPILPARQVTA